MPFFDVFALSDLRGPAPAARHCMTTPIPTDLLVLPDGLTPETVTALAERSVRRDSMPSFQALLAALARAVESTREPVVQAQTAALSLRQRDTVQAVVSHLSGLRDALAAGVSSRGRCLSRRTAGDMVRAVLRPTPGWMGRVRAEPDAAPTWVCAVAAAVESLGETAEHAWTLAQAQPAASSARLLGERVAQALRADRDALLADVARMMD